MPNLIDMATPLRHERDLTRIAGRVGDVLASRFDVVAPQAAMRMRKTADAVSVYLPTPVITSTGVITGDINATYTRTAIRQLAERLRIPLQYVDRLVEIRDPAGAGLAAHSFNELCRLDDRRALYRFLCADGECMLRSVQSDKYRPFDNDIALQAIMTGLGGHGLNLSDCEVEGDVSMDRLRLRIAVPSIAADATDVLGDYRMPFSMNPDRPIHAVAAPDETPPVVWAGLEITNSETGQGAFSIASRAVIAICRNGLTRPIEFRRTHVGAALEQGTIDWSDETRRNALTLLTSQVTDAVRTYLSVEYVESEAARLRQAAAVGVESPAEAVEVVQQRFGLTESETRNVLDCFARGGGGDSALAIFNAITAAAQLVDDGDRQAEIETAAMQVLDRPQLVLA